MISIWIKQFRSCKVKKAWWPTSENYRRYRIDFRAISAAFRVQRIPLVPHIVQWLEHSRLETRSVPKLVKAEARTWSRAREPVQTADSKFPSSWVNLAIRCPSVQLLARSHSHPCSCLLAPQGSLRIVYSSLALQNQILFSHIFQLRSSHLLCRYWLCHYGSSIWFWHSKLKVY